ncbi:MAG: hypothetical protein ACI88A_000643 [Paraglaciecola sp.]|jgi:hypothetical protein
MSSDLLFSILPRQGKVPMSHDEQKVQQVSKLAKLRALSDEEKELHAEELELHEKYQSQKDSQAHTKQENSSQTPQETIEAGTQEASKEEPTEKKGKGPKHLDIYV